MATTPSASVHPLARPEIRLSEAVGSAGVTAGRRVLVVEDDAALANLLWRALERAGYSVDLAECGADAITAGVENAYDAILLDVMIPDPDGFDVLTLLRRAGVDTTVMMISARDSVDDRVRGLDGGADDYLVKPFAVSELTARLAAHLRRAPTVRMSVDQAADVVLDLRLRRMVPRDRSLAVQAAEKVLLDDLIRQFGADQQDPPTPA